MSTALPSGSTIRLLDEEAVLDPFSVIVLVVLPPPVRPAWVILIGQPSPAAAMPVILTFAGPAPRVINHHRKGEGFQSFWSVSRAPAKAGQQEVVVPPPPVVFG